MVGAKEMSRHLLQVVSRQNDVHSVRLQSAVSVMCCDGEPILDRAEEKCREHRNSHRSVEDCPYFATSSKRSHQVRQPKGSQRQEQLPREQRLADSGVPSHYCQPFTELSAQIAFGNPDSIQRRVEVP